MRDIIAIVEIQLIEKIKAYGQLRYQTQAGNITTAIGISPSKLVTTVFLGNKKTHQSTIDATAVLLHRHDQAQPARRPSLVALPISGPWIWQRSRQKTPCLATFWAKLVSIGVFSKKTDSPDFIILDVGRSHGNADRNWNKSLTVTQSSPWTV